MGIKKGGFISIVAISSIIFFAGCKSRQKVIEIKQYSHPQVEEFKKALNEMLAQTRDPFVIIEDAATKEKFVQFFNEEGRISIDVPKVALKADELKRAQKYFSGLDIEIETTTVFDPNTKEFFENESWFKIFPKDKIDDVINISLGVFFEVYQLKQDSKFNIIKGWQEQK